MAEEFVQAADLRQMDRVKLSGVLALGHASEYAVVVDPTEEDEDLAEILLCFTVKMPAAQVLIAQRARNGLGATSADQRPDREEAPDPQLTLT